MISFEVRVRCCYGNNPLVFGECLKTTFAFLTLAPSFNEEGDDLLKVVDVRIDPAQRWYDKAGIRHLYCPEHTPESMKEKK